MVDNERASSEEILDPPEQQRKIKYNGIIITRERQIDASEKDEEGYYDYYYDFYNYTFQQNGSEFYAIRYLDIPKEASFRGYKPPDTLSYRARQWLKEKFYDLAYLIFGKTEWWVTFNLFHPGPSKSSVLEKIPYENKLFHKAVSYLVKQEKVETIKMLTSSSGGGYRNVDIQQII